MHVCTLPNRKSRDLREDTDVVPKGSGREDAAVNDKMSSLVSSCMTTGHSQKAAGSVLFDHCQLPVGY